MYTCPVCGYNRLRRPADDYLICPSCGTEFGYSDAGRSHAELRSDWIAQGMRWFSRATEPPVGWNAILQLERAGHRDELYGLAGSFTQTVNLGPISHSRTVGSSPPKMSRAISVGKCITGKLAAAAA